MAETTWAGVDAVAVVAATEVAEIAEMVEMDKVAEVIAVADDVDADVALAPPSPSLPFPSSPFPPSLSFPFPSSPSPPSPSLSPSSPPPALFQTCLMKATTRLIYSTSKESPRDDTRCCSRCFRMAVPS